MLIPSYFNIAHYFTNIICTARANTSVNNTILILCLIFIIEKRLYLTGIPNNVKSDFAIRKSL